MTKYIFVTGGVVSGLGKGITTASIGVMLKANGFSVDAVKFDPYLNIDPGTMSPYEHGEVYVLADGSETDLDLGHYERFLDTNLTGASSVTAGKIYHRILEKEREGSYLGKNVQLIPHVTDYIKKSFARNAKTDIRLIELGGSTGDFEQEVFLESFRQFKREMKDSVYHIHLGYIPFLACSGEYKTKPMQVSIKELLRSGLQPDLIILRSEATDERPLGPEIMSKVALFSNLLSHNVISLPDQDNIYEVPVYLLKTNVKQNLEQFLNHDLIAVVPDFYTKAKVYKTLTKTLNIGLIAKYSKLTDAYLSISESLKIAAIEHNARCHIEIIDSESLTLEDDIARMDAVIVPGGFGKRGMEGKIHAVEIVRTTKKPFLGICLGLQMAVVEFARNVCQLPAVSREMDESGETLSGKDIVVDYMPEQLNILHKGGTMRLGDYECQLVPGTKIHALFHSDITIERHRHRLEVAHEYTHILEKEGLIISGKHYTRSDQSEYLVEMIELPETMHPYFVATQSHPEFLSRPGKPHPLFDGLIKAALSSK